MPRNEELLSQVIYNLIKENDGLWADLRKTQNELAAFLKEMDAARAEAVPKGEDDGAP